MLRYLFFVCTNAAHETASATIYLKRRRRTRSVALLLQPPLARSRTHSAGYSLAGLSKALVLLAACLAFAFPAHSTIPRRSVVVYYHPASVPGSQRAGQSGERHLWLVFVCPWETGICKEDEEHPTTVSVFDWVKVLFFRRSWTRRLLGPGSVFSG